MLSQTITMTAITEIKFGRSPKGIIWFPGKTKAMMIAIGIKITPVTITDLF